MRIVHTSDWHAGRVWKGIARLPELEAVLEELADFLAKERVDLLLMSGDVFDSGTPNPLAEKLVFGFFKRVGQSGIPSVVIAGNHDSPARLQAWGSLAELVDVHTIAYPRRATAGGVVEIRCRSGECARVAAVPFAPVHRLVSALELAEEETRVRQKYDLAMRRIFSELGDGFDKETVNLVMAHTHLQGAVFSGSEREVHLGEQWATTVQALPSTAHYVALGHIHKPQRLDAAPSPACYAGSPLQLDFGEEGEHKSFVLVEATPGMPARVERVPYEGGKKLLTIRSRLDLLEREAETLRREGWLRVRVPLTTPDPDMNTKVRKLLPNAVSVEVELPRDRAEKEDDVEALPEKASPVELYRAFHRREHSAEPDERLVDAFEAILAKADPDGVAS